MADEAVIEGGAPAPATETAQDESRTTETPAPGEGRDDSGADAASLAETLGLGEFFPKQTSKAHSEAEENAEGGRRKAETPPTEDKPADETKPPEEEHAEEHAGTHDEITDEETHGMTPEQKARLQKRFDKLTAKARSADEQLAAIRAEIAAGKGGQEARAPAPAAGNLHPLMLAETSEEIAKTEAQLRGHIDTLETAVDRAEDNGEREIPNPNDPEKPFALADVKARLRQYRKELTDVVPAAKQTLQQRAGFNAQAAKTFPDLFKAGTDFNKKAVALAQTLPELRRHPAAAMIIGDLIRGADLRLAEEKADRDAKDGKKPAEKPAKKDNPPPRVPSMGGSGKPAPAGAEGRKVADATTVYLSGKKGGRDEKSAIAAALEGIG